MKKITDLNIRNKAVIIRVDFNVPINSGKITSNKRIVEALPTIRYALDQNAKIILLSHLGRIKTEDDKAKKSLKPVVEELSKLLNKEVKFCTATSGIEVENCVKKMQLGEILMLENTRYEDLNNKAESKNNPELGKFWASLGEVFINDAFGTSHRAHASNVGITTNIAEAGVGFLVEKELRMLSKTIENPERPAIAIIGGAKISDKIKVITFLATKYDKVIIGGAMAYTFLKALGYEIGDSLIELDQIDTAKEIFEQFKDKIVLPVDHAMSQTFADVTPTYMVDGDSPTVLKGYQGLDIGPKTIKLFVSILQGAKTVVWNGPLGVTEFTNYRVGTEAIAKAIASLQGVYSIVGGGDSAAAIESLNLEHAFSHISTGGGASLALLEGTELPAIAAIKNK